MDRLRGMEVFVVAADAGSYAAASAKLGMSPQMVSKHIQTLETRLGVRLINRTTRRQSLTEFGMRYLERCRVIVDEAELADSMAGEAQVEPKGRLRISAVQNFGSGSFMLFLRDFLARHPHTEIDLTLTDTNVDLAEDGYEAVFRVGEVTGSGTTSLVSRRLRQYEMIPCASPDYLRRHGTPATPAQLREHHCMTYLFGDRSSESEWTFTRDGKKYPVQLNSRWRINDMRALIAGAADGAGIVLAARETLECALGRGDLVRILDDWDGPSRPLSVVYRADRQQTAALKAFVNEAIAYFGDQERTTVTASG